MPRQTKAERDRDERDQRDRQMRIDGALGMLRSAIDKVHWDLESVWLRLHIENHPECGWVVEARPCSEDL